MFAFLFLFLWDNSSIFTIILIMMMYICKLIRPKGTAAVTVKSAVTTKTKKNKIIEKDKEPPSPSPSLVTKVEPEKPNVEPEILSVLSDSSDCFLEPTIR